MAGIRSEGGERVGQLVIYSADGIPRNIKS